MCIPTRGIIAVQIAVAIREVPLSCFMLVLSWKLGPPLYEGWNRVDQAHTNIPSATSCISLRQVDIRNMFELVGAKCVHHRGMVCTKSLKGVPFVGISVEELFELGESFGSFVIVPVSHVDEPTERHQRHRDVVLSTLLHQKCCCNDLYTSFSFKPRRT